MLLIKKRKNICTYRIVRGIALYENSNRNIFVLWQLALYGNLLLYFLQLLFIHCN